MNFTYDKNSLISLLCVVIALFLLFTIQINRDNLSSISSESPLYFMSFIFLAVGLMFGIISRKTAEGKAGIAACAVSCLIIITSISSIPPSYQIDGEDKINKQWPRERISRTRIQKKSH